MVLAMGHVPETSSQSRSPCTTSLKSLAAPPRVHLVDKDGLDRGERTSQPRLCTSYNLHVVEAKVGVVVLEFIDLLGLLRPEVVASILVLHTLVFL